MTLTGNDLRIGNLFEIDNPKYRPDKHGEICVVIGIDTTRLDKLFKSGTTVLLHAQNDEYKDSFGQYIEFLKPIPLTEEWHNKFGVKLDGFGSFRYVLPKSMSQKVTVMFSGDYVFLRQGEPNKIDNDLVSVWNKDIIKRDMFVHEWQNLYFSLTGEELEFNS